MGRWDDKTERAARKWAAWHMQEYAQHDRVLTRIIEDKTRRHPNHVVFQFRDERLRLVVVSPGRARKGLERALRLP